MEMIRLSEEEKRRIRARGNPDYTPEEIEKWVNIRIVTNHNVGALVRYVAANAYLEAVKDEIAAEQRRKIEAGRRRA